MRDLWRPGGGASRLTWRRLGVLVRALPPESRTKTAMRDALSDEQLAEMATAPMRGHGEWSHLEMLTASVVDLLAEIAWLNSDGKTDRPKPIPRPGVAKVVGINEAGRAYLERLRAGHGARQLTGG